MINAADFLKWLEIFNVQYGPDIIPIPVPIADGGTGVTSVTTAPTATMWAGWDANKNLSANNFLSGYATTPTAAATTTLTVSSAYSQFFTGTTTQIVQMPLTSTLVLNQSYEITNNSTGNVTVQSSGGNTIQVMAAGTSMTLSCISLSSTSPAGWSINYNYQNPSNVFLPLAGGTMSGAIAMGANAITGVLNPVNPQDAMTLNYAGTHYLALSGGTMTGAIAMGAHAITGVLNPVNPQDAMTLNYAGLTYLALAGGTMTGPIAMGTRRITGLGNPVGLQDAMTLDYAGLNYLAFAGGTMSGAISMGSFQIHNLLDPTSSQDAATKNYVDTTAAGLAPAGAVTAATTANFASTYNNGTAGVGATLTATSTGTVTFDGQLTALGNNYLFLNQTDPTQNGIYTVTVAGASGIAAVFTRDVHYDTPEAINNTGIVPVINGSTQAGQGFYQINTVVAIGVTSISYVKFGNSGTVSSITAGTGLSGGTITSTGTIALTIPVVVSSGGTGLTTTTAYGVITGGTTATGLFQNAGTGAAGTVFQGNGASGLPTWSTAAYPSATTINQILYSSAANIITGLATVNSAVLSTSSGGVPVMSTTLPTGLTIPGYAKSGLNSDITEMLGLTAYLGAPSGILDVNGKIVLEFGSVASAVNFVSITNASTGEYPNFEAQGTDGSIGFLFQTKDADFWLQDSSDTISPGFRWYDALSNNYVGFRAPATLSGNQMWTLPPADVTNGIMQSNGSGALSLTASPTLTGVNFGNTTLNYYQEGTWTPTDASGASLTLTASGNYTRIGRMVFASAIVSYPSTANGAGAELGSLPFNCGSTNASKGGSVTYSSVAALTYALPNVNAETVTLFAGASQILNSALSSQTFFLMLVYNV